MKASTIDVNVPTIKNIITKFNGVLLKVIIFINLIQKKGKRKTKMRLCLKMRQNMYPSPYFFLLFVVFLLTLHSCNVFTTNNRAHILGK